MNVLKPAGNLNVFSLTLASLLYLFALNQIVNKVQNGKVLTSRLIWFMTVWIAE